MTESKLIKRVVKGTDRQNVFADVDINNQVSFLMTSFLIFSNFIPNEKMILYVQFNMSKPSLILFKNCLKDKKIQSNWKKANVVPLRIK